jgi:hypothetical protein
MAATECWWVTGVTAWAMIGPSSRSAVTKWAVAPMTLTPLPRLVIGPGALEGGEESVVDVDDAVGVGRDEVGGEDPQVAGEDDEVRLGLSQEIEHDGLVAAPGRRFGGDVREGHAERLGHRAKRVVVADHLADVGGQLTGALLGEEFVQAGGLLADKDGEPRPHLAVIQREFRLQRRSEPVQPAAQLAERPAGRDDLGLDAHEEQLAVFDVLF